MCKETVNVHKNCEYLQVFYVRKRKHKDTWLTCCLRFHNMLIKLFNINSLLFALNYYLFNIKEKTNTQFFITAERVFFAGSFFSRFCPFFISHYFIFAVQRADKNVVCFYCEILSEHLPMSGLTECKSGWACISEVLFSFFFKARCTSTWKSCVFSHCLWLLP